MTDLAIVVAGYNRPNSLSRLLNSLDQVAFDAHRVPLIISLDWSGNNEVTRVAEAFDWKHGKKIVRTFPQRLGLKQHILACGDLTRDFEHLIVLEDDLYVSKNLYRFAVQAIDFYQKDERIAGIALYNHLWNVACDRPFLALDDPSDVYFMQYACSWGQIWSRNKWNMFSEWFHRHDNDFHPDPAIPPNVGKWSDQSWLKHHIRYCIEMQRFFVYPRVGLSTNFSDQGQHNLGRENGYQIPLQEPHSEAYRFSTLDASRAVYDAFFESMALSESLGIDSKDLCVDLYGVKRNKVGARYWLTLESAGYPVLKTFDLAFRPHESNILYGLPGSIIKLYDTSSVPVQTINPREDLRDVVAKYDIRSLSYKDLLRYSLRMGLKRLKAKLLRKV